MTKDEDFKLLKIQNCILRVNIHCDGCKQKVKKLLQRIEGVFQVNIDADQQKVTVSGSIDSATLIKKLLRAGKHAELWSNKPNHNQKQKGSCNKDEKTNKPQKQVMFKDLEALNNQQQKFAAALMAEENDYLDDCDDDEELGEEDIAYLREQAQNQLHLLRQQAIDANNARKILGSVVPNGGSNNVKMSNNGGNGGKKGHPNQNNMGGLKVNSNGVVDQKTLAALGLKNAHQMNGGNIHSNEVKRGEMSNFAGYHGNGMANNANIAAALGGGNGNEIGGMGGGIHHQLQSNNGGPSNGLNFGTGLHPSSMMMNMNGYPQQLNNQAAAAAMMMNLQNRQAMQQQQPQAQMMYHRSPIIPPSTGYYYNYNPYSSYHEPIYYGGGGGTNGAADHSASHMFSDENTSSCSIM